MLVEDEAPLRRIIGLNLARRGYGVVEADSVASADEMLTAVPQPFDAILLDVNLPDMTGWDVLRHLAKARGAHGDAGEKGGHRPAVIVIAAVRPVRARLDEFQPDAVLVKPFPLDVLARLLDRVLTQRQQLRDIARHEPVRGAE